MEGASNVDAEQKLQQIGGGKMQVDSDFLSLCRGGLLGKTRTHDGTALWGD